MYRVRVLAWIEASRWVTADSPEEAQLIAEDDFNAKRRTDFKIDGEGIDLSDIQDQHSIEGMA
jgi:hypothetical protein